MSRRFSDEPVNLIHRIPTPEQMASAGPAKKSFGQSLVDRVAGYVRSAVDMISGHTDFHGSPSATAYADSPSEDRVEEIDLGLPGDRLDAADETKNGRETIGQSLESRENSLPREEVTRPLRSGLDQPLVQPEEIAELRAFLLSQQQDIGRLSAQIQELKSLVVSQQQVLIHLGKELEAASQSPLIGRVAAGATRRNKPVRQKSVMKDKAVAQPEDSARSSLGLWPSSTRRPDL